jgi:hypothetical protein
VFAIQCALYIKNNPVANMFNYLDER